MPYIERDKRLEIDEALEPLWPILAAIEDAGAVNYILTRICGHWIQRHALTMGIRYEHFNAMIGVLACVKDEFVERCLKPYETKKRKENGDVLEYDALEWGGQVW